MQYKFYCSACRARLGIEADLRNSQITCPVCSKLINTPSPQYAVGTMISDFKIDCLIGRGSMGEVYSAYHECMDRWVAIKIMKLKYENEAEEEVLRFRKEIKTLAKFHHPNIINALFAGQHEGKDYLVMNFIEGYTLAETLELEGQIAEDKVLLFSLHIAKAMRHAWEVDQLIHRDIKPDNIMISKEKNLAMLTDLGIAKKLAVNNNLTQHEIVLGSPPYMSPEQGMDAELDCRSDIYSLGASMYHLLGGVPPYRGLEPIEILIAKTSEEPRSLLELNPGVSADVVKLIGDLMARDRSERPYNWEEAIKLIKSCREQRKGKNHFRTGKGVSKVKRNRSSESSKTPVKSFLFGRKGS